MDERRQSSIVLSCADCTWLADVVFTVPGFGKCRVFGTKWAVSVAPPKADIGAGDRASRSRRLAPRLTKAAGSGGGIRARETIVGGGKRRGGSISVATAPDYHLRPKSALMARCQFKPLIMQRCRTPSTPASLAKACAIACPQSGDVSLSETNGRMNPIGLVAQWIPVGVRLS
jgi:hypothetical protein